MININSIINSKTKLKWYLFLLLIELFSFSNNSIAIPSICTANTSPTTTCTNLILSTNQDIISNAYIIRNASSYSDSIRITANLNFLENLLAGQIAISKNSILGELGNSSGINNGPNSIIGTLTNSGSISDTSSGAGTISTSGIYNSGTGATINYLYNNGSITSNSSSVGNAYGISNEGGTIGTLINTGTIIGNNTGTGTARGINNGHGGTVNYVTNSLGANITATGSANSGLYGIYNSIGIYNDSQYLSSTIGTLTNAGTITSNRFGISNTSTSCSSDIPGSCNHTAQSSIISLVNSGTMTINTPYIPTGGLSTDQAAGIMNYGGIIFNLSNNGSINVTGQNTTGIINGNNLYNPDLIGTISNLTNTNGINVNGAGSIGIHNNGIISTLTNSGNITTSGEGSTGIVNESTGTINTLNNSQGGNGLTAANTALTYSGVLATKYNAIINSTTNYGQLSVSSTTGPMAFNIYGNTGTTLVSGVAASTVAVGTYAHVLQGFSSLTGITGTSGTYSGLSYSLVADNAHFGDWNLVFVSSSTNILSGTYQSTNLGDTVNPKFDGGTLQITSAGTITTPTTITSNNGTIDQHGLASTFSGAITDDTSGVAGKLIIENTGIANQGSVTLSGANTYSGGTQVNAGANLSISSGSALGTGTLALVGSPITPATLTTTASTTIANAITVSGDPVFNVASGTTTTASGVITDGVSSGDVVVQGGGTLNLTNTNTYTGPTTIDSGSTLALSGNCSIANSSVANSGAFNIQNTASNVSVAGFSQTSTGNLLINISPTNNQQVNVTGAASLAGVLSLNASAGTYTAGKYTLLTANGVTGTFGSFTSNLSSFTRLGYTLSYDANDVYLNFLPNLLDTQSSLQANVAALQGVYALQSGTVNNSLNYDCNNFGTKGFCVSTGGRYSNASESTANTTSAMIIAGYRINDHLRIGASADQNLYNTDVAQIASVRSNTPLMGAFVVWNQNADKTGFETKLAAGYNNSDLNVNRSIVGTSEASQGSTALNTLSESITASYAFKLGENYRLSPYAGVRHTSVSANGYTEQSTANVTTPLSYNGLNQESTSAILGLRLAGQVYKNTTVQTSAGFEEDMQNAVNNYSATGLAGLSAITFNPNIQRTRAVVNFGASYELAKGHHLGFNTIYRQESFQGVDTKMAYVNYSMGF